MAQHNRYLAVSARRNFGDNYGSNGGMHSYEYKEINMINPTADCRFNKKVVAA